ncbi:hypothetical protein AX16_002593 [Volvariella volvacea WC 439]|nr:hypothetical protein AX16_002593 [Volvariella volvacea WC 439]
MTRFGDFQPLCAQTPSYPWCNLFYRQVQRIDAALLTALSDPSSSAPVGVNPECGIPRVGTSIDGGPQSLGNIANIILCGLSIVGGSALVYLANRRKAAVGRIEIRAFLVLYLLTLPFQLLTTGSLFEQGSDALVILTSIHAGLVAALFWMLLGNALVATQFVEDGTMSSLVPFYGIALAFFAGTTYISFDVALGITDTLGPSGPLESLHSIPLFVLTSIWPGVAALAYFVIMSVIVLRVLNETKPMFFYVLAAFLFVLSQLDYFLLNRVICRGTNAKIDGSFIATLLESAAVGVLYLAWRSITEGEWADDSPIVPLPVRF